MLRRILLCFMCFSMMPQAYSGVFMPENDLHKQKNVQKGPVTEEIFNEVIDEAIAFYRPVIQQQGGMLWVRRAWKDDTVNASAMQLGKFWLVNMFGGLARRPEVTRDGFAMVLCHELGHHLAGYPYVQAWAANEGQSDYFAAMGCARALWYDKPATNKIKADDVPETPRKLCDMKWKSDKEAKLCYRVMMAGKSTADLLGALKEQEVFFDNHDETVVDVTNSKHPDAQCRLDTFMSGALCDAEWNHAIIPGKRLEDSNSVEAEIESSTVTCTRNYFTDAQDDIENGVRPNCWFKSLRN